MEAEELVMAIRSFLLGVLLVLVATPASAQLDQLLKGLGIGRPSGLSEAKIGSGLKEALKVGGASPTALWVAS